jgi:hypothetical protein
MRVALGLFPAERCRRAVLPRILTVKRLINERFD